MVFCCADATSSIKSRRLVLVPSRRAISIESGDASAIVFLGASALFYYEHTLQRLHCSTDIWIYIYIHPADLAHHFPPNVAPIRRTIVADVRANNLEG